MGLNYPSSASYVKEAMLIQRAYSDVLIYITNAGGADSNRNLLGLLTPKYPTFKRPPAYEQEGFQRTRALTTCSVWNISHYNSTANLIFYNNY